MTNEKKIIIAVSVFLLLGFAFLSFVEWKAIDPAGKNSWWTIYFENPKSTDLTFTIENNGKAKKLHWKEAVKEGGATLKEADVTISAGQKITIPLSDTSGSQKRAISIEVTDATGGKKEIYKIL